MTRSSPKISFVSLGCPKVLVDSDRILTQLRPEGYEVAPHYDEADLVVVNTCRFIEVAVDESLDAIGEALAENGKIVVTGCLGARAGLIRERHPGVLAVTGPQRYGKVLVDEAGEEGCTARGPGDAPELDGSVFVEGAQGCGPGDLIKVRIPAASDRDLWARALDAQTGEAEPRRHRTG